MSQPRGTSTTLSMLAVAGGLGFWLANLAISLTPIAAAYRDALGIRYVPMLLEAALGGVVIGLFVSGALLRWPARGLTSPLARSLMLSALALIVVTGLIGAPASFFSTLEDPGRWFIIGTLFNVLRILALGVVIGLLHDKVSTPRRSRTRRGSTASLPG